MSKGTLDNFVQRKTEKDFAGIDMLEDPSKYNPTPNFGQLNASQDEDDFDKLEKLDKEFQNDKSIEKSMIKKQTPEFNWFDGLPKRKRTKKGP
jgi:hypothetical protein